MKRIIMLAVFGLFLMSSYAQDVVASYNLSKISSYVKIDKITPETFSVLKDSITSLQKRYHSSDFVVDMLQTKGDYGMNAVILADSLAKYNNRLAMLIGPHTEGAAAQVAMFMNRSCRAVLVGAPTKDGLNPDILLESNENHLTQWYDSIHQAKILEKAAQKYAASKDVASLYKSAEDLLENFKDNGVLIDLINEIGAENGIKANKNAFYYSGYTVMSEIRAELIKIVYPNDKHTYFKAVNVPVQQAIFDAMETIESAEYRKILFGESN